MEFLPYTIKWLEVILRWGHVLFAILWVGNSFLFNYLDNNLNKNITSDDIDGEGYLMHSGFFYKLSRLKTSPPQDYLNRLVIFKWQSYLTFVTGMLLLIVIYYYNAGVLMVDKRVLLIPPSYAIIISLLSLIVFWLTFEYLHLNWDLSWPWLTLGNCFSESLFLIKWYEYTGVLGGTLWILFLNVLFYELIVLKKKKTIYFIIN